jgi:hypothetical protein
VECQANEIEKLILPLLNYDAGWIEQKDRYLSSEFASKNPSLGLQTDCYYFLVAKDGSEIIPTEPYYPYSGQWGAYCPFGEMESKTFDSLEDLKEME